PVSLCECYTLKSPARNRYKSRINIVVHRVTSWCPRLACLVCEPYTCAALQAVVVSGVADRGPCRSPRIDRHPVVATDAAAQRNFTADPVIDVVDRCAGNIRLRSVEPFIAEIDQTIKVATAIGTSVFPLLLMVD